MLWLHAHAALCALLPYEAKHDPKREKREAEIHELPGSPFELQKAWQSRRRSCLRAQVMLLVEEEQCESMSRDEEAESNNGCSDVNDRECAKLSAARDAIRATKRLKPECAK